MDYNRKTVRNYLGRIDQKRKQKPINSKSNYPGKQSVYRPSGETRMKGTAYIKGSVFRKDTGNRIRRQDRNNRILIKEVFWYEEENYCVHY